MAEVYLNRRAMRKNNHRVYSIREAGKVISKANYVLMEDVNFVVQQAGRIVTIERLSGVSHFSFAAKTVHAFLRGKVLNYGERAWRKGKELGCLNGDIVNYNPLIVSQFALANEPLKVSSSPIHRAKFALCHKHHIHAILS